LGGRTWFWVTAGDVSLRLLIAAAAAATVSVPAADAQRVVNAQLLAFSHTPFYAGLINRGLAVVPQAVFHKCPTLRSVGSQLIELSPVIFAPDGYPNSGEWKQRFPVTGCGNDTILNFYFTATPLEKINTAVGIPGETRADIVLQRDAKKYAVIGATLLARSCWEFDILNSKVNEIEGPAKVGPTAQRRIAPAWSETWTLQGCGRRFNVDLRFEPSATDTLIVQHGGAELR